MRSKATMNTNSLKWFSLVAGLLLVAGYLAGYFLSNQFSGELQPALQHLQNLALQIRQNQSVWHTFWTIFLNNVVAALFMIVLGIGAGIFPALMIWLNGLLMGFVTYLMVTKVHVPAWKVVVFGLLPHGIFELTALILASGLGLQIGFAGLHSAYAWSKHAFAKSGSVMPMRSISFRGELRRAVFWFPFIVGLLLLAAIVESTITPFLLHWSGISG